MVLSLAAEEHRLGRRNDEADRAIYTSEFTEPNYQHGHLGRVPTLSVGQSLTLSVRSTSTASGPFSGTPAILSNASDAQLNIPLSGTGATTGQLTLTPLAMSFRNVTNGTCAPLSGTLVANRSSITLSSATSTTRSMHSADDGISRIASRGSEGHRRGLRRKKSSYRRERGARRSPLPPKAKTRKPRLVVDTSVPLPWKIHSLPRSRTEDAQSRHSAA